MKENKSRVPALNRCLKILELLQERPHLISEIVTRSQLPRSTVYVVVEEMLKEGLIRMGRDGRLNLWMRLVDLGCSALKSYENRDLISRHIEGLVRMLECSCVSYGVIERGKGFYVIEERDEEHKSLPSRIGARIDLLHTAIGRCLLAYTDENSRSCVLEGLETDPLSLVSPSYVAGKLELVRSRGWASDESSENGRFSSAAVPLFSAANTFMGAIEASFDAPIDSRRLTDILDVLRRCSLNLTMLFNSR